MISTRWLFNFGCFILLFSMELLYAQSFSYIENRNVSAKDPYTYIENSVNDRLSQLLFSSLYFINDQSKLDRDMAESEQRDSHNLRMFTIRLRKGMYWKDGAEVTSEDVLSTIRLILNPATQCNSDPYLRSLIQNNLERYDKVDRYSISVTLRHRFDEGDESWKSIFQFPIVPASVFHTNPPILRASDAFTNDPDGSGPFYYLQQLGYITLLRNKNYQKRGDPAYPLFQTVNMYSQTDEEIATRNFLGNPIYDMLVHVPLGKLSDVTDDPLRVTVQRMEPLAYNYLGFNFKDSLFRIPAVREAFSRAIDRMHIISHVFYKQGEPIAGPFNLANQYVDLNVKPDEMNLDSARSLLESLNIKDFDHDGYREFLGKKISLHLILKNDGNTTDKTHYDACIAIVDMLGHLGIEVKIDGYPRDQFMRMAFEDHNFDLCYGQWSFGDKDGDVSTMFASSDTGKGRNNHIGYTDHSLDQLFNKFNHARDVQSKKEWGYEIYRNLANNRPYMFLWSLKYHTAWKRKINIDKINPYRFFDSIYRWSK